MVVRNSRFFYVFDGFLPGQILAPLAPAQSKPHFRLSPFSSKLLCFSYNLMHRPSTLVASKSVQKTISIKSRHPVRDDSQQCQSTKSPTSEKAGQLDHQLFHSSILSSSPISRPANQTTNKSINQPTIKSQRSPIPPTVDSSSTAAVWAQPTRINSVMQHVWIW